ncbi:hypothetical protein [Halomonas binhaiensis]|uniref:Carboxypeptidase regulatory-like domain-containing protein n=1 Tax=Halomonas binhaiensis TaxID=2562282 RepID=A0A7U3HWT5_9GAMM|nr:hypothetical protein [Halomonas binhaiensis]QRG26800.1 hypothetical protein E4T21_21455 [Halomonas binhaiensis]
MNKFTVPVALLALGATCFSAVALAEDDSAVQQRFREQGKAFDLSKYLQGENDARSRSFTFGSPHAHDFTVKSAGVYRFESKVAPGYADNYRIEAVLMDAQGQVIARDEGNGNSGGLKLEHPLEPGEYTLQVQANRGIVKAIPTPLCVVVRLRPWAAALQQLVVLLLVARQQPVPRQRVQVQERALLLLEPPLPLVLVCPAGLR